MVHPELSFGVMIHSDELAGQIDGLNPSYSAPAAVATWNGAMWKRVSSTRLKFEQLDALLMPLPHTTPSSMGKQVWLNSHREASFSDPCVMISSEHRSWGRASALPSPSASALLL